MSKTIIRLVIPFFCLAQAGFALDAGSALQNIEKELPSQKHLDPDAVQVQRQQPAKMKPKAQNSGMEVYITLFKLEGNTLIDTKKLIKALKSLTYKKLTYPELSNALRIIENLYLKKGHIARAYFPPQEIINGVVKIAILEGALSEIKTGNGLTPEDAKAVMKYVDANQKVGTKISMKEIERALYLIHDATGMSAMSSFEVGDKAGESKLNLNLSPIDKVQGAVFVNNYGARATGKNQLNLYTNVNSPLMFGDKITTYVLASDGIRYGLVDYSLPVGFDGLRLGTSVSHLDYKTSGVVSDGAASVWKLYANYPLYLKRDKSLIAKLFIDEKSYKNNLNNINISNKDVRLYTASLSAFKADDTGEWNGYAAFSYGQLDLSKNSSDLALDASTLGTQGDFAKAYMTLSRDQYLTNAITLKTSLNAQVSNQNLDSSEKLYLGGPFGVRAYPVNEAGGDSGYVASMELHYRYRNYDFSVFKDHGVIIQNHNTYAGWESLSAAPNRYALNAEGIGFEYDRDLWSIKGTMAWRRGSNPNAQADGSDNDGTHDAYQLFFNISRGF